MSSYTSSWLSYLDAREIQTWRLVYDHPRAFTPERFEDTYNWMVGWGLVIAGATYDESVDNRAWE